MKKLILRNVTIPAYTSRVQKNEKKLPPYPILRKIYVKPGSNIFLGRLWCHIEFFNPLTVPLRFYYLDVDAFVGQELIGTFQVNLTNYDPFIKKPGYVFSGYSPRPKFPKNDPYGPQPSNLCHAMGDCQEAPILVESSRNGTGSSPNNGYRDKTTLSKRMETFFKINKPGVLAFWKSIAEKNISSTYISVRGKVLVGINPNTSIEHDPREQPDNPQIDPVILSWIDFTQGVSEMIFQKFWESKDRF